jgi:hypothetical protein
MVWGRDTNGIDRFVLEQLSDIFDPYRFFATLLFGGLFTGTLAGFLVAVADVSHYASGSSGKAVDMGLSPTTRTDDGNLDGVVGPDRGWLLRLVGLGFTPLYGQCCSCCKHGLLEESAARKRAHERIL